MSNVPVTARALSLCLTLVDDETGKTFQLNISAPSTGFSISLQEVEVTEGTAADRSIVDLTADPPEAESNLEESHGVASSDEEESCSDDSDAGAPTPPKATAAAGPRRSARNTLSTRNTRHAINLSDESSDEDDYEAVVGFSQEIY